MLFPPGVLSPLLLAVRPYPELGPLTKGTLWMEKQLKGGRKKPHSIVNPVKILTRKNNNKAFSLHSSQAVAGCARVRPGL